MKHRVFGLWILIIVTGILFSCRQNRIEQVRDQAVQLAEHINTVFSKAAENSMIRKRIIEDAYENRARFDLSIDGMDVADGGSYQWLEDYIYYPVEDKFNGVGMISYVGSITGLYIDPDVEYKPENFHLARQISRDSDEMKLVKEEIRLWEHIIVEVNQAGTELDYDEYVYFCNPRMFLATFSMFFDQASMMTPNFTQEVIGNMDWMYRGTPYGNPEGIPLWADDVWVGAVGEGWIIGHSIPVYSHGDYIGNITSNLYPLEIAKKNLSEKEEHLLFISGVTSLLGITDSAKKILQTKEIEDFDYLAQLEDNSFVQEEFKLIHESQTSASRELGQRIMNGEREFELEIDGNLYKVIVAEIPETGFFIVGLVE